MRVVSTARRPEVYQDQRSLCPSVRVSEPGLVTIVNETLTPTKASRLALTSAPKQPDDPSAFQRVKNDPLPLESLEAPNTWASCCANLASCISYLRFTSISGNSNRKMAMEESSITWRSNVVRRYATHREKT